MLNNEPALLLASASPRRKELLARLGVEFEVVVAPVVEHEEPTAEPRAMVLHNAVLKAAWVCAQRPGALVLAADTTVAFDGEVLNKPRDMDEARAMLQKLSGRTHTVYTGVCLWRKVGTPLHGVRSDAPAGRFGETSLPACGSRLGGRETPLPLDAPLEISHCETSAVTFRPLDDAAIAKYFALVNPLDKAGAYGIQEGREIILERYAGSFTNIMGLPLEWVAARLHELSLIPSPTAPIIDDSTRRARHD